MFRIFTLLRQRDLDGRVTSIHLTSNKPNGEPKKNTVQPEMLKIALVLNLDCLAHCHRHSVDPHGR